MDIVDLIIDFVLLVISILVIANMFSAMGVILKRNIKGKNTHNWKLVLCRKTHNGRIAAYAICKHCGLVAKAHSENKPCFISYLILLEKYIKNNYNGKCIEDSTIDIDIDKEESISVKSMIMYVFGFILAIGLTIYSIKHVYEDIFK